MGRLAIAVTNALGSSLDPVSAFMNGSTFYAPLKSSLVLTRGTGSPTFTRATVATVVDFEGLVRTAKSGEARFTGARRVENLFSGSTVDFTHGAWAVGAGGTGSNAVPTANYAVAPDGSTTASRIVLDRGAGSASGDFSRIFQYVDPGLHTSRKSIWLKSNSGSSVGLEIGNTGAQNITVTTTWQRFAVPVEASGDGYFFIYNRGNTPGGAAVADISAWGAMYERVTGQANQNPSEYVSVGVLSAPYHGAGVDGVKYFETQNGNTVASNVVTEATGAAIADATLKGYLAEGARTNRCLYSQDFSNAAWVASNVTKASNEAVAPDGTTTADTLTATAGNGTVIQDLGVVGSAAKTGALWIKRKTGTGNIDLTMDGGTGWTTQSVTSTWTRFPITQTLANEDFGIRIVTSGDAVWVWQGQVETASFASSDIVATSAAVARNADALTYQTSGNVLVDTGTVYLEYAPASADIGGTTNKALLRVTAGAADRQVSNIVANQMNFWQNGAISNATYAPVIGTTIKLAARYTTAAGNTVICSNGTLATAGTMAAAGAAIDANMGIGYDLASSFAWGNVRNARIGTLTVPNDVLQAATR